MGKYPPKIKQEAIRLRMEEHLGLKDIASILGISKGTASLWLRGYPLSQEIITQRKRANGRRTAKRFSKKDRGKTAWIRKLGRGRTYSTAEKAMIAETAALLRATVYQFRVYGSPFDGDKVDWVIRVPRTGKLWKVQVKTVEENKSQGLPTVSLRCNMHGERKQKRRYERGEFDFIVGYDFMTDTCYVWSWDDVSHLSSTVTISPDAEERWDKLETV